MFFSKSLVSAIAFCLSLSLQTYGHAAVAPALGVSGTPVHADVKRPSTAKPCGNVNIARTIDSSSALTAAANGSFTATITNFNAGVDGSRQVTAQVDATGTGTNFVSAQVLQNGDRTPTDVGSQQLVVEMPAGTTCTGGATGDKCLVSFKTVGGFGNCVVVQQTAGAATSGTAAVSNTTDATGTATTGATTTTGKTHKGKAAAAAKEGVNQNSALDQLKAAIAAERNQKRAFGPRAARIARRAAERPAVEVL